MTPLPGQDEYNYLSNVILNNQDLVSHSGKIQQPENYPLYQYKGKLLLHGYAA